MHRIARRFIDRTQLLLLGCIDQIDLVETDADRNFLPFHHDEEAVEKV